MLRALEEEEFEKLPGGIFNKGFVRAYSRYLGLDEEQAVADYLSAETEHEQKCRETSNEDQAQLFTQSNTRSDNVYAIRASADSDEQQPDQAAGFMTAAVIIVILLGMGGFAWKYLNNRSVASAAKATPISQPADNPPAQPPQTETPPPSSTATIAATSPSDNTVKAPSTVVAEKTESQTPKTDLATTQTAAPELAPESKPATPDKFKLEIRADEESWVQIKADGTNSWTGVITANSNKSFRATKEMVVKLGNASGVELSYNGKPLPRFTSDTKIKTLTFTPEGLSSR
jgi:cytoskeleton protein RodZ